MEKFYNNFSFMLAFMIFIVFFNMMFGEKATTYFLALVLLGMAITNVDEVSSLFTKIEGAN